MDHEAPKYQADAFNCPFCNAYANMNWSPNYRNAGGGGFNNNGTDSARCARCRGLSFWLSNTETMIFPAVVTAPLPHPEMPQGVRADYNEAREIAARSPRAAAALLRLVIQKLCKELGESGVNLNDDIGNLVKKGLSVEIQQALDIVRVVGNNAIHPGELSDSDVSEVSNALFGLINHIVDDRIAKPKKLKALFSGLPEGAKQAIVKRDGK